MKFDFVKTMVKITSRYLQKNFTWENEAKSQKYTNGMFSHEVQIFRTSKQAK